MERTIFLSYAREDSAFVRRLAEDLRAEGFEVWLDQIDIRAGELWDVAVEKALARSAAVLVVLSPASVASRSVLDEVFYALDENKTVIPVLHQTCELPFRLRRLHYSDFTSAYAAGLTDLCRSLVSFSSRAPDVSANPQNESERASAATYQKIQQLAHAFFTKPLEDRQIAAKEVQQLSRLLTVEQTLELSVSSAPGERLAAGIILRDKLDLDYALSRRADIHEAIRRGLMDPESRVRYRYIRAAEVQQGLTHSAKDLLQHIAATDKDPVVKEEARRVLARHAIEE